MKRMFLALLAVSLTAVVVVGTVEVRAQGVPGTGTLTGTVTAPVPFTAAKVYARQMEKNILFMVYTEGGKYRAVNLFPGNYEVSAQKPGMASWTSDVQKVKIDAGKNASVDLVLKEAAPSTASSHTKFASYDEIYKSGPGRKMVEDTCITCHGVNFLPGRPGDKAHWNAALDLMFNAEDAYGIEGQPSMVDPGKLGPGGREALLDYLVKTFGPDSGVRAVIDNTETPLDEKELGKAMYVEYNFPNTPEMPKRYTQEPFFDSQGNVWVTERGTPSAITRLNPRTGEIKNYMNPNPKGSPHGMTIDSHGQVWWTGRDVYVASVDPETGAIKEYKVDHIGWHGNTPYVDSKDNIWISMLMGNKIGKFDRATEKFKYWENPTPRGRPYGFFVSPDDKIWYAQFHTCKVTKFDPETESFTEYSAITQSCTIRRLGLDSKQILWFGVYSHGRIGRLDTKTGTMSEMPLPRPGGEPYDVWPDREDNVWISDGSKAEGALIRYDQKANRFTYYPAPQRTDMPKLRITREGAIWYAPRSVAASGRGLSGLGVLYPDKDKIKDFAAKF